MITIHIIILFLFPIFVNFDWQILNLILLLFLLLTSKIDAIAGAITNSMLLWEFALVQYCDHSFFSNIFIEALDSVLILAMPKVIRSLFIGIFHLPLSFFKKVACNSHFEDLLKYITFDIVNKKGLTDLFTMVVLFYPDISKCKILHFEV